MSVGNLYCEGQKKKIDIRVLQLIVSGVGCRVIPTEGKRELEQKLKVITTSPDVTGFTQIISAGIRDRDFETQFYERLDNPQQRPINWMYKTSQIGWVWERKEIENYLIDPVIIRKTLADRVDLPKYEVALQSSAESLTRYTTARVALSLCRYPTAILKNRWGEACGLRHHCLPQQRDYQSCVQGIEEICQNHRQQYQLNALKVLDEFQRLLLSFETSGSKFSHFLTVFSGKDLVAAMGSELMQMGLGEPGQFLARILKALETSPEPVWEWLPEWQNLRNAIATFPATS